MSQTVATQYRDFCRYMLSRLEAGDPPRTGLCTALANWSPCNDELGLYQDELFKFEGLSPLAPFNPTPNHYCIEREAGVLYKNSARLDWLRKYAEEVQA